MLKLLAPLVGAFFFLSSVANATIIINEDGGGVITDFELRYETIRAAGDNVRVEGECDSACTLILSIIPHNRVCVTQEAAFGFHSATERNRETKETRFSVTGTAQVWNGYPEWVRKIVRQHGWDGQSAHPDLVMIPGTKFYPLCRG